MNWAARGSKGTHVEQPTNGLLRVRGLDQVGHRLQGVNGQGRVVLDPAHGLEDVAVLQVNGFVEGVLQLGHGHLRLEAVLKRLGLKGGMKGKGGKSVTVAEEIQSRSSHLIPNILDQSLHLATRAKYVRDALVQLIVAVEACVRAGEREDRQSVIITSFMRPCIRMPVTKHGRCTVALHRLTGLTCSHGDRTENGEKDQRALLASVGLLAGLSVAAPGQQIHEHAD